MINKVFEQEVKLGVADPGVTRRTGVPGMFKCSVSKFIRAVNGNSHCVLNICT